MQLDMFGASRAAAVVPGASPALPVGSAAVLPARYAPPALLSEHLAYHEDGPTAGEYLIFVRNPHFGDWIHGRLVVRVERQFGRRPLRWMASVDLELPDEHRTWWGERAVCATQDEAAEEAAAMLVTGRALLEASARGEPVETPGDRRRRAAEEHADAEPEVQAAARAVADALALRREMGATDGDHPEAHRRYLIARQEHEAVRQRALDAFYAAHGWREFA